MSNELCDFCSRVPVVARYHAEDFIVEHLSTVHITQQSLGDWAACATCERVIDAGDWQALALRCANIFHQDNPDLVGIFPRDVLFEMYTTTFDVLQKHAFHKVNLDGSEL